MKNEHTFFELFACCFPVFGVNRSIICDTQRGNFFFIPNALYEILIEHNSKSIYQIKKIYDNEVDDIIDEYFDFLINNELIFFTNEPDLFPQIDLTWKSSSIISNALIDNNIISNHNFKKIFKELDRLNCKSLEIRFFDEIKLNRLQEILSLCKNGRLQSISLLLKYATEIDKDKIEKIADTFKKVTSLVIHSAPNNDNYSHQVGSINTKIFFTTQQIDSSNHCGLVGTNYFSINLEFFLESQQHNSCLNRKVSIDVDGNIKNCPSMRESYGNTSTTTLKEAIEQKGFKKYWNINKDQIDTCKDCEFRHVCTDCRAFTDDPENKYSKPLKCGYSPYTNEWEEWSTNPLKNKLIEDYNLVELK